MVSGFFFFNDTAPTEIYPLSLHDALPISPEAPRAARRAARPDALGPRTGWPARERGAPARARRSEEHTSELQSRSDLVCRLLLEKKKHTQHNDESERHQRLACRRCDAPGGDPSKGLCGRLALDCAIIDGLWFFFF